MLVLPEVECRRALLANIYLSRLPVLDENTQCGTCGASGEAERSFRTEAERHSGIDLKLFGFIPELVFSFIPES